MDTMPPSTHGFLVSSVEERDAGEGLGLHAGKIDILSHQNLILIFEEAGRVSPRLLLPPIFALASVWPARRPGADALSERHRHAPCARPRHASTRRATWPDKTIPRCVHGWT